MFENVIYKNSALNPDERAKDLLSCMTISEKIGQLIQVEGFKLYEKKNDEFVIKDWYKEKIQSTGIGAMWAFFRADWWTGISWSNGITPQSAAKAVNTVQRFIIENTRLGIPIFISEECAHGFMALGTTVFPTGLCQAATFNTELMQKMGHAISEELHSFGGHIAYGPVLDVARDARWSRVEEGFGEDPYLLACMGSSIVKGLQEEGKVIATLKHFAAHGQPEGGHNSAPAHVGENELRNIHLNAFKESIKAGALSVMSSYNDIDGVPCTGSYRLLTEILRNEWGFEGFVVSDAGATNGLADSQRVAEDYTEAAAIALKAGVDSDLCGIPYLNHLELALQNGMIQESNIDKAVFRIIRLKFQLGLFDNPYVNEHSALQISNSIQHRQLSLDIARNAVTLLENKNNTLPLSTNIKSLVVIGPNADSIMNQLGDYTSPQKRENIITPLDGIKQIAGKQTQINYTKGCKIRSNSKDDFENAIALAKKSDSIVLVLGGSSAADSETGFLDNGAARITEIMNDSDFDKESGEGYDRGNLELCGVQIELLKELKKTGKPIIAVLIQGRPLILSQVKQYADAILLAWYPGCMGGLAIAEALFGKINPAGRLPISIPLDEGQLPIYYNSTYYRSDYIDMKASPLYSFGYGLSYTSFEYSDLKLDRDTITSTESTYVSVNVKNVGKYDGDEVVQLYVKDLVSSCVRPIKELKGFKRIHIQAGEEKTLHIPVGKEQLGFYNTQNEYVVENGNFEIIIGGNSQDGLKAVLTVKE